MAKITISRVTCRKIKKNGTLTQAMIRVLIRDDDYNILFEGDMELEDYGRLISGESEIPITERKE